MRFPLLAALAAFALSLAGCAGPESGLPRISQAGSSTVLPLAEAWAEALAAEGLQVVVAGGGSGAGASKLCAREIHLADLSRPMRPSEIERCRANGVEPAEWAVAYDGLSVVVSSTNDFVDSLSVAELRQIWKSDAPAERWSDVRPEWPEERILLFGPDPDSGTYEYFNEEILGKTCGADGKEACAPRRDYAPSVEDNVLVEGVARSPNALGHFGLAYLLENQERLRAVPIRADDAADAVAPTFETIVAGTYRPLSRPLYVYTDGVPEPGSPVHRYLAYVLGDGQDLVRGVGYVELDDATVAAALAKLGE